MDTSVEMMNQVKKKLNDNHHNNGRVLQLDLLKDPITEKFDCIFSLMALHHIQNYQELINKLSGLLNDSGYLCLADLDKEDGSFHQIELNVPHHGFEREQIVNEYKKNNLIHISSETVFNNKKIVNNHVKEFPVFLTIGKKSIS